MSFPKLKIAGIYGFYKNIIDIHPFSYIIRYLEWASKVLLQKNYTQRWFLV